jgi:hypothetical protein
MKRYAVGYGTDGRHAIEVEYNHKLWTVRVYEPLQESDKILRTTVHVIAPATASIAEVMKVGRKTMDAVGGDEEICENLPPKKGACYKR